MLICDQIAVLIVQTADWLRRPWLVIGWAPRLRKNQKVFSKNPRSRYRLTVETANTAIETESGRWPYYDEIMSLQFSWQGRWEAG